MCAQQGYHRIRQTCVPLFVFLLFWIFQSHNQLKPHLKNLFENFTAKLKILFFFTSINTFNVMVGLKVFRVQRTFCVFLKYPDGEECFFFIMRDFNLDS